MELRCEQKQKQKKIVDSMSCVNNIFNEKTNDRRLTDYTNNIAWQLVV